MRVTCMISWKTVSLLLYRNIQELLCVCFGAYIPTHSSLLLLSLLYLVCVVCETMTILLDLLEDICRFLAQPSAAQDMKQVKYIYIMMEVRLVLFAMNHYDFNSFCLQKPAKQRCCELSNFGIKDREKWENFSKEL